MSSPSSSLPLPGGRLRLARVPRRAGEVAREVALIGLALALCPVAAALTGSDRATGLRHAYEVVDLERALGLWVEPAIHGWLHDRPGLATAASFFYLWVHVPATGGALVWIYLNRRAQYAWARTVFVLAQTLTVVGYLALPVAPPRMLGGLGFHDTLAETWGPAAVQDAHSVQSAYAAMPSGHVVFALVAALALCRVAPRLWVRALLLAYPALVVVVIVATANHYVLDAVGAGVVVVLAVLGERALNRRRPAPAGSVRAPSPRRAPRAGTAAR